MWTDSWIGTPYRELGRGPEYDCLGLFVALQRARCGREIFDPACTTQEAVKAHLADRQRHLWRAVDVAREGDALLFKVAGEPVHLGFALNNKMMLHTEKATGAVIEDFRSSKWGTRLEGIYRYAG